MKTLLLASLFASTFAFADMPVAPGTKVNAEITGAAASILAASMEGPLQAVPAGIDPVTLANGATIDQALVKIVNNSNNKISIACFAYYYRGHQATCKMLQEYK